MFLKRNLARNKIIKSLFRRGLPQTKIAQWFGISRQRVHQIVADYWTLGRGDWRIFKLLRAQENRCFGCNEEFATNWNNHHTVPLSRGGTDDIANLVLLCRDCHYATHREQPKPEREEATG